MKEPRILLKVWTMMITILVVTSCTVTKPYQRAEKIASDSLYRGVNTTDTVTIANIPWNKLFGDTLLLGLIDEGIHNNLDLQVAVARIKAAEANFKQSTKIFYPAITANLQTTQEKLSDSQGGNPHAYELYAGASWEADIWGKLRSNKRAMVNALMQSVAYRRAVQTQLVSDIASNYYALLAYDAQLKVTDQTVANRKEDVETMKILKESDVVTGAAVVQSAANRFSAEVTLPDLRQNIRETENALSVLLGRSPGGIQRSSLDSQAVWTDLSTGIPLQLLANRPDVQEAEYQLRYYFELTNVARTYFYPALTITAQGGFLRNNVPDLFTPSSIFGNIIGGLAQPVFNQGLNEQRLKVAQANQEQYLAAFRKSVLSAGQEVSNALYSYGAASEKIDIRAQQIENLRKAVDYTRELLKYTTTTNYTDVLTSEQSLLAAQLNGINDRLQQLQATVDLYRSLGGGWK